MSSTSLDAKVEMPVSDTDSMAQFLSCGEVKPYRIKVPVGTHFDLSIHCEI